MLDAGRAAMRLSDTSLDPHGPVAFWGYSQGFGAAASAAELAPSYAPDLHVVGTYAGAPPADLKELFPYADGSALVGVVGYAINSVITAYPEFEEAIRATLTPRGVDLLNKVQDQCIAETITKFMFRHLQPYFNQDINQLVNEEPFSSLFDMQRIGTLKPNAPVMILSNRYDPLVPWIGANQLGRDWCGQGADVQFWTNEEPPFLNKLVVNHALPMLVDGERAMQWIADRFNGLPTTPNCGEFERGRRYGLAHRFLMSTSGCRIPASSACVWGCVVMYASTLACVWPFGMPSRLLKNSFTSGWANR